MYNIQVNFIVEYYEFDSLKKNKIRAKSIHHVDNDTMRIITLDNEGMIIPYKDFISARVSIVTNNE